MSRCFHVPINSIYVELVRLRYRGEGYGKYHVRYYSKASGRLIAEERNVKILHENMKHWTVWPPNDTHGSIAHQCTDTGTRHPLMEQTRDSTSPGSHTGD